MPSADRKVRVLFLCTGNSCRSQMAEGWAHRLLSDVLVAHSAGTSPGIVNPHAVAVMAEAGVDISGQASEPVSDYLDQQFDYVVTLCGDAQQTCPAVPGDATVIHRGFDDPPALTRGMSDQQDILDVYRRVRDEIRQFIELWPDRISQLS